MSLIEFLCRSREFKRQLSDSRERLYRVAYSWCHDAMLADDLTQQAISNALKKSSQLRKIEQLNGWLFRILHNCWLDHHRQRRDTVDIDDLTQVTDLTPEVLHARSQTVHQVRAAVARLPIGQRQVLTLVDLEGCSYIEVANIMEIPVGTVMSRLNRARQTLKIRLLRVDQGLKPTVTRLKQVK